MGLRSMEDDHRPKKAVLWAVVLDDNGDVKTDGDGKPFVGDPVEIDVRWEQTTRIITNNRSEKVSISVIATVDRDIVEQSHLWLGALEDLPDEPTKVHRVEHFDKVPDLKGRKYHRVAMLSLV